MDPKAKIPLSMVAEIAERAYRRGFQQGHWASENKTKLIDLTKWRFDMRTSAAILPETGKPMCDAIYTSLERLAAQERGVIETYLNKEFHREMEWRANPPPATQA